MTAFVTFAACWSFGYTVADLVIGIYQNYKERKHDEELKKIVLSECNGGSTAPNR